MRRRGRGSPSSEGTVDKLGKSGGLGGGEGWEGAAPRLDLVQEAGLAAEQGGPEDDGVVPRLGADVGEGEDAGVGEEDLAAGVDGNSIEGSSRANEATAGR